jgi:uncharacterized membrane protein YiaA
MKKPDPIGRLRQVAIPVIGLVGALDLGVGIYHLTHQGTGSGITELILAVLLSIGAYLILQTRQKSEPVIKLSRFRKSGITIIALIAATFLVLGIYHLTHHGLPSGIIELCMTSLLATIVYLTSQVKSH